MSPTELAEAGRALYGRGWQTRMAEALGVDGSTVRRWVSGAVPVPGPAGGGAPTAPSPCRPDPPGEVPAIEPLPSTAKDVIEDRHRAPGATFSRVPAPTAPTPHE